MPDEDATDESTSTNEPTPNDKSTPTDEPNPTEDPTAFPDCPLCGQPVATVTIHGPTTAVAAPCGCRAPPEVLLVDPESDRDCEDLTHNHTDADPDSASDRDSG